MARLEPRGETTARRRPTMIGHSPLAGPAARAWNRCDMRLGRAGAATALLAVALPPGASAAGPAPATSTTVTSIACRSLCGAGGAVSPGGPGRPRRRGLQGAARVVSAGGPSAPAVRVRAGQADARVPG